MLFGNMRIERLGSTAKSNMRIGRLGSTAKSSRHLKRGNVDTPNILNIVRGKPNYVKV